MVGGGVGLSVILETRKLGLSESTRQVINKSTAVMFNNHRPHHSSSSSSSSSSSFTKSFEFQMKTKATTPTPSFLDRCFLCAQKLLPGKDIFMYEGDKGFCSEECRCRQIFMDEEEETMLDAGNCSFAAAAAINPQTNAPPPSPSPSPPPSRRRKSSTNHAGGFAY